MIAALFSGDPAAVFGAVVVFGLWFGRFLPAYCRLCYEQIQAWRHERRWDREQHADVRARRLAALKEKFPERYGEPKR